jgi:hypothetical protein
MQRGLRITVAVAIATGAAIATAGTALASDNDGPINVHQTPSGHHAKHHIGHHLSLPELNGH